MKTPSWYRGGPSAPPLSFLLPYVRTAGLVGLCLIVFLSIVPGRLHIRTPVPNVVEHFVAYFAVAFTLALGFGTRRPMIFATVILMAMIIFSGALEFVQELVPGRTGRFRDWAASSMGATLGSVFAVILGKRYV